MKIVNKTAVKDDKCKKMFEKLNSKSTEEVKSILHWEFDKLVMRGATGIGVTNMRDFDPDVPRTEEDKKQSMMDMIVFASMMNKEDCTREVSVQWSWEE